MKNLTNLKLSAQASFLIFVCSNCASLPSIPPPPSPIQNSCSQKEIASTPPSYVLEPEIDLSLRTLEIDASDKSARLYYPFRICTRRLLWACLKEEQVRIYYDLLDQGTKIKLKDKDFVCRVREKP